MELSVASVKVLTPANDMFNLKKTTLSIIGVAGALALVWQLSRTDGARAPEEKSSVSSLGVVHDLPTLVGNTSLARNGPLVSSGSSQASLMQDYAHAQGLRAFVASSLKRAKEGGITYAYAAFEACYGDLHGAKGVRLDAGNASSGEAKAKLLARCDLSSDERSEMAHALMSAKGSFLKDDPILALTYDFLRNQSDKKSLSKYVDGILETQNIFGMYAILSTDPQTIQSSQGLGYYFDGVQYLDESSKRQLEDAFIYTTCSYGAPCSDESVSALRLCADRGWCGSDVQSALSAGYAQQNAGEDFLKLAARLGQAFRNKEASAFLR